MLKKNVYLRSAEFTDAELLFMWSNEKDVRKNLLSQNIIDFDEHVNWLKRKLDSTNCKIFIMMCDTIPLGRIIIDIQEDIGTLSYSLDERYRGSEYGKTILQLIENWAFDNLGSTIYLVSYVKEENVASQKVFEDLGYCFIEIKPGIKMFKKKANFINSIYVKEIKEGGVILLTNNRNCIELFDWLSRVEDKVYLYSEKLSTAQLVNIKPDIIISYNYKYIISQEIIAMMKNNIINLHISFLPWNKGSNPNFWSFIDNTKKGVTIHYIDKGLDTGCIIAQEEVEFDEKTETFRSSYSYLNYKIIELFKVIWKNIKVGRLTPCMQIGNGSSHNSKDFENYMGSRKINWDQSIADFKNAISVEKIESILD